MQPSESLKVAFFTGCTVNFVDPGIGLDSLAVLRHNGVEVFYPRQKCCGVPSLVYGDNKGFIEKAKFNIRSLEDADCDAITCCTSCALALKEEYPAIIADPGARKIAAKTYDIMEYVVQLKKRKQLNTAFQRLDLHVLYHAPCHLKCLGRELIDERLHLLQLIPGIHLERINRGCCGMGGTFGMKKKNYDISMSIGAALAEAIKEAKPDMVITECPGCKMQIEHLSGTAALNVQHPIHLLRLAYGI